MHFISDSDCSIAFTSTVIENPHKSADCCCCLYTLHSYVKYLLHEQSDQIIQSFLSHSGHSYMAQTKRQSARLEDLRHLRGQLDTIERAPDGNVQWLVRSVMLPLGNRPVGDTVLTLTT